jgi:hypothetical protein
MIPISNRKKAIKKSIPYLPSDLVIQSYWVLARFLYLTESCSVATSKRFPYKVLSLFWSTFHDTAVVCCSRIALAAVVYGSQQQALRLSITPVLDYTPDVLA